MASVIDKAVGAIDPPGEALIEASWFYGGGAVRPLLDHSS
jgi:hypothetical protein